MKNNTQLLELITWFPIKNSSDIRKLRGDGQTIFFRLPGWLMIVEENNCSFPGWIDGDFDNSSEFWEMFLHNLFAGQSLFGNLLADDAEALRDFFFGEQPTGICARWNTYFKKSMKCSN